MGARHEPAPSPGGGSESRGRSRHSVARTDPLYWARARAAAQENDPRAADDPAGPDAVTEQFPSVDPEWSGRLPLPTRPGLPARRPWSGEERLSPADATTDSLPVVPPVVRYDDAATTLDLPAVPARDDPATAETVDYRDHPLALVPRPDRAVVPYRSERTAMARRAYTGRHRLPETVQPVRLGLSTVGMTVAIGVLGVTLAMLHAQPGERSAPPLAAVSPTGTPVAGDPDPGVSPSPGAPSAGAPSPGVPSTPGPGQRLIPRPSTTPGAGSPTTPGATRPAAPAVAPGAPAAGGDDGTTDEEEAAPPNAPRPGVRPTRTRRPEPAPRPTPRVTPRCATSLTGRGAVRTNALAADDSAVPATGSTQADPDETPDEPTPPTDEPTDEPAPSASCP